ncbi:MAG: hypothetical protein NZ651_07385, partial [Candidatus Bipolaricaulota bacterium]|nr:hypothetical protein [Candidatus Bipolaricaulota bacterium]MDW8127575.1 hypothetical protein [Candidatus Bipolaricaulota bacterium]
MAEWVQCEVEAIYEALRGIRYTVERKGLFPEEQEIRTFEELLSPEELGGPCLDLVLLMAACLEHIGLHPLVVIIDNPPHAILGYWLDERQFGRETPRDEVQPLFLSRTELEQYKDRLNRRYRHLQLDFKFVECTGLSRVEDWPFKKAVEKGERWSEQPIRFILDVETGRRSALRRQMQDYLRRVQDDALVLPPAFGFPPDMDFRKIRVQVKVRRGPRRFSEAEARARETARRGGWGDDESASKV